MLGVVSRTLLALGLVTSLLLAAMPVTAQETPLPPLGLSMAGVKELQASGAPPRYGSYWVGAWMAKHGWGGFDGAIRTAKETGVTPVIYWYYWGDGISANCVEYGCDGKSKAQWFEFNRILADKLRAEMGGKEVLVVLENEFNKNSITDSWYAPKFDGYLESHAKTLKSVPGVKIVLGFGAWGESNWDRFPKAAAQSDYIGFQMMRGSTRHTEAQYRGAADAIQYYTDFIGQKFNRPSFLYDLALSSYPDANWERIQKETLEDIFSILVDSGQRGLQGVVYRSLRDNYMDPINYFGAAESHWGLKYRDGGAKPAWWVWKAKATSGVSTPPPAPNVPGSFEAESMRATTGGRASDPGASGGAAWNLWANGQLSTTLATESAQTVQVTVHARGDAAMGVNPSMDVLLNGQRIGTASVPPGAFQAYRFQASLPAGASTLAVAFTNDIRTSTEDRNLIVDRVVVGAGNRAPAAAFEADASELALSVDASASSDPDGDSLTYAWSFGDGATASGRTATHAYAAAGSYTVTLKVSDGAATATATRQVTVQANRAPSAVLDAAGDGLSWKFDATGSSDPDGDAMTYAWSFGDGATATGATAQHRYAKAGSYAVTLTVSDGKLSSTATRAVDAKAPAPTASIAVSGSGRTWTFDGSGSADPLGGGLSYSWRFSDGGTATGAVVTRTFAGTGDQTAQLTVRAADGQTALTTATVTAAPFQATFRAVPGNNWWVQVNVQANEPVRGVCASVDGGACQALKLQSWGDWAASFHVPKNAQVRFTATSQHGGAATSDAYVWPSAEPVFTASFSPRGNNWWIQTPVDANQPVQSVCASVNRGPCQALRLQSWGEWAASFHIPTGAEVVVRATSASGQVAASPAHKWLS